jgi:hypothetical protein
MMCDLTYRQKTALGLFLFISLSAGLRAQDKPQFVWQGEVG